LHPHHLIKTGRSHVKRHRAERGDVLLLHLAILAAGLNQADLRAEVQATSAAVNTMTELLP
jgi:hypothetical protein